LLVHDCELVKYISVATKTAIMSTPAVCALGFHRELHEFQGPLICGSANGYVAYLTEVY